MHRYVLPLLAASALAAPAVAEVQVTSTGPVVALTVQESVEAEPDIATVSAGVTTEARTAVEAMKANAAQMTAVIARIKALGIAERDIQTTGINLGAMYDYDQTRQRQVFRGYQASNRVSVKMRDIDRTGEALSVNLQSFQNVESVALRRAVPDSDNVRHLLAQRPFRASRDTPCQGHG